MQYCHIKLNLLPNSMTIYGAVFFCSFERQKVNSVCICSTATVQCVFQLSPVSPLSSAVFLPVKNGVQCNPKWTPPPLFWSAAPSTEEWSKLEGINGGHYCQTWGHCPALVYTPQPPPTTKIRSHLAFLSPVELSNYDIPVSNGNVGNEIFDVKKSPLNSNFNF